MSFFLKIFIKLFQLKSLILVSSGDYIWFQYEAGFFR